MKETRENKENRKKAKALDRVSKISLLLAIISLVIMLIPDPIPVVDEIIAIRVFICSLIIFVVTFLAASAVRKDGSAEIFLDNLSKASGILNMFGNIKKLIGLG